MKQQGNILVLTYWSYADALVQTYTLPYVRIISKVAPDKKIWLLTLEKNGSGPAAAEGNIRHLPLPYKPFGLKAGIAWLRYLLQLRRLIKKERIQTIHCWCTPAGMIGYILSRLSGAELIIDSYEPHADAMTENGEWSKSSNSYKLLSRFEKLQTHHARWLIATTEGMKEYASRRFGHNKNNFFVKPACVDLELFSEKNIKKEALVKELKLEDKIVCVYAGKFGGIYLESEIFDFFKAAEDHWGDRFRGLVLSSHQEAEITAFSAKAGLQPSTVIHRFVPHSQVPDHMGLGDFGITPVKPVPSKRYCTPIKDGEYWALGLPVVITKNISDDSSIILKYKIGSILEDLNRAGFERSVKETAALLEENTRHELYRKIRPVAEKYRNFMIAETIYRSIYSEQ